MSSTHCFLRTENQNMCHEVLSAEFMISQLYSMQALHIVCTGNFIMYALHVGLSLWKQSHV